MDAVLRAMRRRRPDYKVIRVNAERLATNSDYCFRWESDGSFEARWLSLRDSGLSAVSPAVVWYRKPDIPSTHPVVTDPNAAECCRQEWREFIHSFRAFFPEARWVNDYWRMQESAVKPLQIRHAERVGLCVPETLITNDLEELRRFAAQHSEIIVKPLYFSGFLANGKNFACFTSVLTPEKTHELSSEILECAPMMVQRRIPKHQELRVTVIGERVFACEIITSPDTPQHVDWRIDDVEDLPHRLVEIPDTLKNQLRQMLSDMGLRFGAFDLIRDIDDRYYFLELNPNGQYYWIEILTGAPLSDAMATLIFSLEPVAGEQALQ